MWIGTWILTIPSPISDHVSDDGNAASFSSDCRDLGHWKEEHLFHYQQLHHLCSFPNHSPRLSYVVEFLVWTDVVVVENWKSWCCYCDTLFQILLFRKVTGCCYWICMSRQKVKEKALYKSTCVTQLIKKGSSTNNIFFGILAIKNKHTMQSYSHTQKDTLGMTKNS